MALIKRCTRTAEASPPGAGGPRNLSTKTTQGTSRSIVLSLIKWSTSMAEGGGILCTSIWCTSMAEGAYWTSPLGFLWTVSPCMQVVFKSCSLYHVCV